MSYINYELKEFHNQIISSCELFTTEDKGYIPMEMVLKSKGVVLSKNTNIIPEIKKIYGVENFEDLMVFDAIIGNTDRHLGNFGMFIDNNTNQILEPAPIFDNGLCFLNHLTLDEIKNKDYLIKEYNNNGATTNCFNQTFEKAIKLYVSERHLESLKKLKDFILEKDKNYNLSDEWLKGFESNIRENAKKFIEIFKEKELAKDIKQLSETLDISLLKKIGVDKVNEVVICRILECNNLNLTKTQDFFNSLKEALKIQDLLIEKNLNELNQDKVYKIVDNFLEKKSTKDIKVVSDYLKKNDFPISYIEHFDKKIKFEAKKGVMKNKKVKKIEEPDDTKKGKEIDFF